MIKPITLTLYAPDYESSGEKKEYVQVFIPWKMLKEAMRLSREMSKGENVVEQLSDELIDSISNLVVTVFGNRFSVEELEQQAEMMDVISVVNQIVTFAGGNTDPTIPVNPG